jgi:uncharacterized membrane protein
MTETHLRTITRLGIWRIVALSLTAYWVGINNALIIHVMLTIGQYIYERAWLKLSWGKIAG